MIINKGGCDRHSPGIGDVAYVKNLILDKIVTRNFRCSKFGLAHHPGTKFGWVGIIYYKLCNEYLACIEHIYRTPFNGRRSDCKLSHAVTQFVHRAIAFRVIRK